MSAMSTQLRGRGLALARLVWLAVVAVAIAGYLAGLLVRAGDLANICVEPAEACAQNPPRPTSADAALLQTNNLTLAGYSALETAKLLVFSSIWFILGGLVFARGSGQWAALATAFFLATWVTGVDGIVDTLVRAYPIAQLPAQIVAFLRGVGFLLFVALFPNGRFVPGWTRWIVVAGAMIAIPQTFFSQRLSELTSLPSPIVFAKEAVTFVLLLAGQIIRYRRLSTQRERQQIRWVIFGLAGCFALITALVFSFVIAPVPRLSLAYFGSEIVYQIAISLIPLSVGLAILRYRLWNIDVIVRRTLVYGLLTALLVGIYFGSVALLQAVITALTGQARSELVTVVSTLAIAGLVLPLRNALQKIIDRRFYRRKFNAEQALARFSAEMRDAVEMDAISTQLMDAVEETMQPERMVMWIQPNQLSAGGVK